MLQKKTEPLKNIEIFNVKSVSFDEGERDPFGFDSFSEDFGKSYLPFSGTTRKPIYFVFVGFVDQFLQHNFKSLSKKEKYEYRIRLEKLLVYSWKRNDRNGTKKVNIIGSRFELEDIDPFTSKWWVKQNCFKIYTFGHSNFKPQNTIEAYWKNIGESQSELLVEFLNKKKYNEKYLEDFLLKNLNRKKSLFHSHYLHQTFRTTFAAELKKCIKGKKEYFDFVCDFFKSKKLNEEKFYQNTLLNKHLPFIYLNDWFSEFIRAVDSSVKDPEDDTRLWNKANQKYEQIAKNFKNQGIRLSNLSKLNKRQKPRCWFIENNGRYELSQDSKVLWQGYMKRQNDDRYFFNFRHAAFKNLLKELKDA